ncbi:MAG: FMN-binding negative transcriptional regulator [Rhizobiales bacterium]|nr:FMN-binding negative transcriptional regulator [Hyphomicrobiales bacterium]
MYVPPRFENSDEAACLAFMQANSFAMLVSQMAGHPFASHLPLLVEKTAAGLWLTGHVARANPHWQSFDGQQDALAIFHGAHGYISPRWYVSPEKVPTWNYVAVHAYGAPVAVTDKARGEAMIARLVAAFETGPEAWDMARLSATTRAKLLTALVPFEMPITRLEGKWKLGQHMDEADRLSAARAVGEEGQTPPLAALMGG